MTELSDEQWAAIRAQDCAMCGLPYHRYCDHDPEHDWAPVACVNSLRDRVEELEKGLRAILPWKLREIAEWFDTVDKLLDALSVNGLPFREQYEMPRKSEIQEDVRRWADTVEALVRAALGGEE